MPSKTNLVSSVPSKVSLDSGLNAVSNNKSKIAIVLVLVAKAFFKEKPSSLSNTSGRALTNKSFKVAILQILKMFNSGKPTS